MTEYLDIREIKSIFKSITEKAYCGIKGVIVLESGMEGPTLGITINTHGNEPCGLYLLREFIQNDLEKKLKRGKVIFVLNNIEATRLYFESESFEEKREARFIDINMNRLPEDILKIESGEYEIERAKELYDIYKLFDYGLDIHSTEAESTPMLIDIKGNTRNLFRGMPIKNLLTNIANVQKGIPVCMLYGGLSRNIPTFEIEGGSHENPDTIKNTIESAYILLYNLKMIDCRYSEETASMNKYKVIDSLILPSTDYKLSKAFSFFDGIGKGEILASNGIDNIYAKQDGHILFPPKDKEPSKLKINNQEEVMFLSEPVKKFSI